MTIVRHVLAMVVLLAILVAAGCKIEAHQGESGTRGSSPKVGATCTVQFRRDALGAAANLPVPPTTNSINGADVSINGKFRRMDQDWIVLECDNKETWIPRDVVLLIQLHDS